ncbi:MAG: membrane protein [Acidimicrobiia bacterium]|nr:MAG: membrane protein [Acidimicrobiia bacterium]
MSSNPPRSDVVTVGGQAVIEGVMMRAPSGWAVAVRTPEGRIQAVRHPLPRLSSRSRAARIPFIRGILVLGESLTLGFRALSWSAQKAVGEDEEPLTRWQMVGSLSVALLIFAGVFIVAPALAADAVAGQSHLWFATVEALIRIALFVGYIWLIGRSREIQRVFRYHGAEHMAIHAYEAGEPLSVEAIGRHRPEHPRCGTSFLLIVMLASIVLFTLLGRPDWPLLVASRVLGIPVIAGVSYELLRWSGTRSGPLSRWLAAPGLWLQKLTTGVPDRGMIEVAVCSLLSAVDPEEADRLVAMGGVPEEAAAARATSEV